MAGRYYYKSSGWSTNSYNVYDSQTLHEHNRTGHDCPFAFLTLEEAQCVCNQLNEGVDPSKVDVRPIH